MRHSPRFHPGSLTEVTCRIQHGRFLLRPSRELNAILVGALARAQELNPGILICAVVFMSNHYHLLLRAPGQIALSRFMAHLNHKISHEIGRLHRWRGRKWDGRYDAIPVSDEEAAQVGRLRYLLSQGCKEFLVEKAHQWPGVNSVRALIHGKPLEGHWPDRTAEARLRAAGRPVRIRKRQKTLHLTPLPCWEHLDERVWRRYVADLVIEVDRRAAEERRLARRGVVGKNKILELNPHHRPEKVARRPAPNFHAASREALELLRAAYRLFVDSYREAARRLRNGEKDVQFPPDCFPPPRRPLTTAGSFFAPL